MIPNHYDQETQKSEQQPTPPKTNDLNEGEGIPGRRQPQAQPHPSDCPQLAPGSESATDGGAHRPWNATLNRNKFALGSKSAQDWLPSGEYEGFRRKM